MNTRRDTRRAEGPGGAPQGIDGHAGPDELVPTIVERMRGLDEKLVEAVRARPVAALAVALTAGYLAGRVISRLG